jgi:hypothetical protein
LRKTAILALVTLVIFCSYLPLGTYARSNLLPAQGECPTYLTNLTVDYVNSLPTQITTGDVVTTIVHVIYADGSPVTLQPQTMSFLWNGTAGQQRFGNVPVTYAGRPGYYNYTQTVTPELAQATVGSSGAGKITIYVAVCSCSDPVGNRGPTGNISSDETLTPSDDSHLNAGPQTPPQQPISYSVPLVIAILLILAILLFLRRSRRKKK